MKEVIQNTNKNIVGVENTNKGKYYGFNIRNNSPGYISADCMLDNPASFQARFFYAMTEGNNWTKQHDTIQECISDLLSNPETKVYEFDTYQKLFTWAAQQN